MPRFQRKKIITCAALCAAGIAKCSVLPADGISWCHRHNEERLKLYAVYKTHGLLLNAYHDIPECYKVATIMTCDSLSVLREWNNHLRGKYNLLTRCIEARVYFSRRFFGEDMDFGHKVFWDNLVQKRSQVEQLLAHLEMRGYKLVLKGQNALWVLEQGVVESDDCSGHGGYTTRAKRTFRSTDSTGDVVEDPLEAVLRGKANDSRERIRLYLAGFCASPTSPFHNERSEVVRAYVRRAIYRDASLMFLSQNYDSVDALLSDQDLDYVTMEKIWEAVTLRTHDVHSAVDDVLRSTDGEHVTVLGGKVFKDVSGERWPLHGWGHMMAIRHCYLCLRITCRTMDQVIDLTRYALLTGAPLSRTYMKYNSSFDGSKELMLAGFVPHDIPFSVARHSIAYKESGVGSTGPIWEETERNLFLFGSLSLTDPMAQSFVNACIRHPDFMVMLRKGPDARIIRSSSVVWISRKRCAQSRSALTSVPWDEATEVTGLPDLVFKNAWPSGSERGKIAECMQVVFVDTSKGSMGDFIRNLVQVWCQVYKVDGKEGLYAVLKALYAANGELEEYQEVTFQKAVKCYQSLWGCKPPVHTDCF